ncbi:hypothetical protein NTPn30_11515 [Streptococcus pneumoniae]|nr:hypothetical protein NTPn30_11515 [Streptococcus pneumoniae]
MARNELRFGILGPLALSAGFRSLPLGTPKQRAVLATLIIHRNRPVGIDSLIDAPQTIGALAVALMIGDEPGN